MKATILAKLLDELSRQQIPFSVDEVHGQNYKSAFGIKEQDDGDKAADGVYLQVWATKNSLSDDIVTDFLNTNFPEDYDVCNAPTNDVDHNEWLYLIKIED